MRESNAVRQYLPAGAIVPAGWVALQARQNLDGFLGQLPRISSEVSGRVFSEGRLGPDSSAAGNNVADVEWWNGESEGSWLLGYAGHVRMVGQAAEREDVAERLASAVECQGVDGYLGMFTEAARADNRWLSGDCWTSSRLLLTLADWAEANEAEELGTAVSRALHHLEDRYERAGDLVMASNEPDTAVRGHDLQVIDILLDVARRTGDASLVGLARDLYRRFCEAELSWFEDDAQLHRLASDEPFHGHGPHVAENLRIPLRLYEFTHEPLLLEAARSGWIKLQAALGVTGALRSDEAVGEPGERPWPLPEAGYEYCAITELAITALDFGRITGDRRATELAESLWLNAAQAARHRAGTGISYFFAENQTAATVAMGHRWDVSPTHDDAAVCCSPNAGRILPVVLDRSVQAIPQGLSVQLYGPMVASADVGGRSVRLRQRTAYPFDEKVAIEVSGADDGFVLELRIPSWCKDPGVRAFAGAVITQLEDRFVITGAWPPESIVELIMAQPIRSLTSVDGRTALAVGPLVMSWPIPDREVVRRHYPDSDLTDRDLVPADDQFFHAPFLLESGLATAALHREPAGADPWQTPGLELMVRAIDINPRHQSLGGAGSTQLKLVPIGTTSLRATCLNVLGAGGHSGRAVN